MTFTDPGVEIQQAVYNALQASAEVQAFVKEVDAAGAARGRIFDRVPRTPAGDPNTTFPFISFGELDVTPINADVLDAAETHFVIHTWSRKVGSIEAKQLNAAIAKTLHDAEIDGIQSILMQDSRVLPDPDGITSHGVLRFQILTDANS